MAGFACKLDLRLRVCYNNSMTLIYKRYFVIARDHAQFMRWLAGQQLASLQDCRELVSEADFQGLSFSSPHRELMFLRGWETGARQNVWVDWCIEAGLRYMRDKRVNHINEMEVAE